MWTLRVRCLRPAAQGADRAQRGTARADHRRGRAPPARSPTAPSSTSRSGSSRYYADLLKTYPMTEDLGEIESWGSGTTAGWRRRPPGWSAAIIAYNYPNQLALAKLVPALAAGCTVVLKGAPDTPLITLALGELIAKHTDIPAGVVNVLSSSDPAVGAALTTSPDVDLITFTGSTATGRPDHGRGQRHGQAGVPGAGRQVRDDRARRRRLRHRRDDGGVHDHARTPGRAARSPRGCWCRATSTTRSSSWSGRIREVTYGDPADPETYMGPLISERQRDKVDGMVAAGRRGGRDAGDRREEGRPGLLLRADAAHRRRPGQRDRPGGGVRAGPGGHPLRR